MTSIRILLTLFIKEKGKGINRSLLHSLVSITKIPPAPECDMRLITSTQDLKNSFFLPLHIISTYYHICLVSDHKSIDVYFFSPISYSFLSCPKNLCSTRKIRFEKICRWINDDRIFIFGWIISLNKLKVYNANSDKFSGKSERSNELFE